MCTEHSTLLFVGMSWCGNHHLDKSASQEVVCMSSTIMLLYSLCSCVAVMSVKMFQGESLLTGIHRHSFTEFKAKVMGPFEEKVSGDKVVLFYQDKDGDLVVVASDKELQEVFFSLSRKMETRCILLECQRRANPSALQQVLFCSLQTWLSLLPC